MYGHLHLYDIKFYWQGRLSAMFYNDFVFALFYISERFFIPFIADFFSEGSWVPWKCIHQTKICITFDSL